MATKYFSLSPYNSMGNNPVYYNNPNGDAINPLGRMAIGAGIGGLVGYGAAKLAGKDGKTAGYWAAAGFAIGVGIGAWNPDLSGIFKGTGSGAGDYNFSGMRGGVQNVDDIYVFNKDGTFSGEVIKAPGEDVGMVRDFYGEGENLTCNFVDPENTPSLLVTPDALSQMLIKTANNGEFYIDRVEFQGKFDIQAQLMSADAFGPNPGSLYSLLTESRGFSARLDYSAKGSLLDRTSTLFLTEGADGNYTGHDFRNYGNFLWGATTKTWGVPGFIARMGANADVMWNEGSWDSGDDQRSIQLGRDYAKQMGWKRRSF